MEGYNGDSYVNTDDGTYRQSDKSVTVDNEYHIVNENDLNVDSNSVPTTESGTEVERTGNEISEDKAKEKMTETQKGTFNQTIDNDFAELERQLDGDLSNSSDLENFFRR